MSTRVTQHFSQHLAGGNEIRQPVFFTQSSVQIMGSRKLIRSRLRITQHYTQMLAKRARQDVGNRFTQHYVQILMHMPPDFRWIDDMFLNEVFPYDISFNSIGATKFATDVVITDSGNDQRLSRWEQPLMEYDVAYGVRTMEHLHGIIAFFRAMQGRKYGFLYWDVVDHSSTLATRVEARAPDEITPYDQFLGLGTTARPFKFKLRKLYEATIGSGQGSFHWRPIQKPKLNTVRVALGDDEVTNFTVNYDTGEITFFPAIVIDPADSGSLNLVRLSATQAIIGDNAGLFSEFNVGDDIIMYGWANGKNNVGLPANQRCYITNVAPGGTAITVNCPTGDFEAETSRTGVGFQLHPAPKVNVQVRAGFHFYVPVRFDTDRLPVTLEEYGIGGAADVKLIELRPSDALPTT